MGFDASGATVIVSAATNRPEKLILAASMCFDQVLVDRPDPSGREEILNIHARKVGLSAGGCGPTGRSRLRTPRFAGADLHSGQCMVTL